MNLCASLPNDPIGYDPFGVTVKITRPALTLDEIRTAAAEVLDISYGELIGDNRDAWVCARRFLLMLYLRDYKGFSYPQIGRACGRRDHTTARHGVARARAMVEAEPGYATLYRRLCVRMEAGK